MESLSARVIDGIWIGSDELKERVMLSPGLAKAWELLALVETREMPLRAGIMAVRQIMRLLKGVGMARLYSARGFLDTDRGVWQGCLSPWPSVLTPS